MNTESTNMVNDGANPYKDAIIYYNNNLSYGLGWMGHTHLFLGTMFPKMLFSRRSAIINAIARELEQLSEEAKIVTSLLNSSTADELSVATMPNSTNVPLSPNPTLLNLWEKEGEEDIFQGCRLSIAGAYSIFKPMAKKLAKEIGEKYITPLLKEVEELKKENEQLKGKINNQ